MILECLACRGRFDAPSADPPPRCPTCGARSRPHKIVASDMANAHTLAAKTQCPHCWERFPPERVLWIAQSEEFLGDPVLGPHAPLRLSPSRFTVQGKALDPGGLPCEQLACPRCHLPIPFEYMVIPPAFVSLVGAPGSGKSFMLASLTHSLRRLLPSTFRLAINDIDAVGNAPLLDYEKNLFHHDGKQEWVTMRKTETQGTDLYHEIMIDGVGQLLPRPLQFMVQPLPGHPAAESASAFPVVFYDNAGESFMPGADAHASPVTRHIAHSRGLVFVIDPTKDAHFRRHLSADDPQTRAGREVFRQDVMLGELAQRIRRLLNLKPMERHKQPLVVAVSKFDLWRHLIPDWEEGPAARAQGADVYFDRERVARTSDAVRQRMGEYMPECVAVAESNWGEVTYIPFSATGCSPVEDPDTGMLGLKPSELDPQWAETPFIHFLDKWTDWLAETPAKR